MSNQTIHSKVKLNTGNEMPVLGLGVYLVQDGQEVYDAIRWAIESDYRLIDTATLYENEQGVGKAVKECGVGREELFVTTKLWPTDFNNAQEALENSLRLLNMEYVDLYLLHWPGTDTDARHRAWDTVLENMHSGKVRACGVSNFHVHHLEELIAYSGTKPANNQVELHPWYQRRDIRAFCAENDIAITAWGPIFHGHLAEEPLMAEIGKKYGKSAAQVTLRWHLQNNICIIPKSIKQSRIRENADIFNFEISEADMQRIDALDGKGSFGPDAETFSGT